MAFDKEKFIKDAKAAGYGDDEINAELAASSSESSGFDPKDTNNSGWDSGRSALPGPSAAIATALPQAGSRVDAESKRLEQKRVEKEQQAPVIPDFIQNPLMLGGAAAAGGAAVLGYKTLRDKMANSAAQPTAGAERREPSLFGAQRLDEPTWSASDPQHAPLSQEEMMNRLRGLAGETSVVNEPSFAQVPQAAAPIAPQGPNLTLAEAQARMAGVTPPVAPTTAPAVVPAATVAPVAVPEAIAPVMTEAPKPVVPTPSAPSPEVVMPSRPVTPTPTGELRTGAGLPAYAGEGKQYQRMPKEFPSVKDVPAGYAFVPGVGPGTNTIRNLETPEGYKAAVQLHGSPFGSHDEAVAFMNQYNAEQRMGPPADRTLRKSLGLPLQENTKGIAMKAAKVGGVVGAIMAIPDLANAAQNRDVGQAANVASGFLHPALQALIYSGGLNAGAEEENRQLRMRDYALKAGRGVAQGYDPRQLIGVAPPTR